MIEWIDDITGRKVRQITNQPNGASLVYFRMPKRLPGMLVFAYSKHKKGNIIVIEPESGYVRELPLTVESYLKMRESDGRMWYVLKGR